MRRFVVLFIVVQSCLLFTGCKKKEPFREYEGSWKPVVYQYSQGIKSFGTQRSYSLSAQMDSLVSTTYNQNGSIETQHTYLLSYSINTVIRDENVLVIDEKYYGLDSTGKVVINLSNKNEVTMSEGRVEYGSSTEKQTLKPDRITTSSYTWSGMNTYNENSELVKIQ